MTLTEQIIYVLNQNSLHLTYAMDNASAGEDDDLCEYYRDAIKDTQAVLSRIKNEKDKINPS